MRITRLADRACVQVTRADDDRSGWVAAATAPNGFCASFAGPTPARALLLLLRDIMQDIGELDLRRCEGKYLAVAAGEAGVAAETPRTALAALCCMLL